MCWLALSNKSVNCHVADAHDDFIVENVLFSDSIGVVGGETKVESILVTCAEFAANEV